VIEAALVQVGRSVVTSAIRLWVTRQQRVADRSLPLVELINRQVTDAFARRKVERGGRARLPEHAGLSARINWNRCLSRRTW
jgi:hypothetical protein